MENMIAQRLGGHAEIERNTSTTDIDGTLSRCFDNPDIYHPELLEASCCQNPSDIAEVILKAATSDKPHFRYQTSEVNFRSTLLGFEKLCGWGMIYPLLF